ncbi:LysR family transcriptional regulator [Rhizobium halophytocola]|uniref:DNA-binding transcriptional LysR family regulator n=1 Tax=Rhizobium halophytocola TaxID=735519 RepID=A0ABS4DVW6_9HYPH|nr:LysR family transcriptional regulator [Rhizobium halophytocola]MBP1849822.1 DNA-binding transcriptional LysR family regulator [Rhizobium halophytocola]
MLPNPTLDQLQVFIAVAEAGSFSAAARQLNRAQSVVSYTIGNLEAQLQLVLFDRQGRQPVLTEAGRAMLDDARRIIAELDNLRARSKALNEGLEGEVRLAVSVMVPDHGLTETLKAFQLEFPTVMLRLYCGTPRLVSRMLDRSAVDLAIGGGPEVDHRVESQDIGLSYLAPVAAPEHRLSKLSRKLSLRDVREDVQIIASEAQQPEEEGPDFNVFSRRTWRVSDMATKRHLLLAGLGWGGVPLTIVREDLAEGRLVRLDVEGYDVRDYPVLAQWHSASPPGPAGRWIIDQMAMRLAGCPRGAEVDRLLRGEARDLTREAAE